MGEQITYSISESEEKQVSDIKLSYFKKQSFDLILNSKILEIGKIKIFSDMCRINTLYSIKNAGSGHLGSSFSSLDIVSLIYLKYLKQNDKYFSSKGHDSPALYSVQTALGILPFEKIHMLRRFDGLPGHPDIETEGSFTNTGSLGMGVSKAKGFLYADSLRGNKTSNIFVLTGDGELQVGQFWESLTSREHKFDNRLTIIVDFNKIQSDTYVKNVSNLGDLESKFKSFGLDCFKLDGHDLEKLDSIIKLDGKKPKIIIADTIKGKGVSFMEHTSMTENQYFYKYHSGAPSDEDYCRALKELLFKVEKNCIKYKVDLPTLCDVKVLPLSITGNFEKLLPTYSETILDLGIKNSKLIALDADLVLDTGLIDFSEKFPERFVECGISEQDMVSQAGTMALSGLTPVVHSFACFLTTRPIEQIYNNSTEMTKVIYVGSLAGILPGGPGHSHQSVKDVALMSSITNMTCIEPFNPKQVKESMNWVVNENNLSSYVRLVSVPFEKIAEFNDLSLPEIGKGNIIKDGKDFIIFVSSPVLIPEVYKSYKLLLDAGISITIVAVTWLNNINIEWLKNTLEGHKNLLVIENHDIKNGFGDYLLSTLSIIGINHLNNVIKLGIDKKQACGRSEEVLSYHNLDSNSIVKVIKSNF